MTKGNTEAHLCHVSRATMLHGVNSFFSPPDASGHDREDPRIAQSKLDNGDSKWKYIKEILG